MTAVMKSRNGIEKVRVILTCDYGHEDSWTMSGDLANGGNLYCNECDAIDGTWRGVIFHAYDDSLPGN